ncbi:nucleotidyltransferase family protein [Salinicola sp. LHM]|uniref:N-acetylmuramate alpha-1-phosphate uridylyltransferase MurU n=1 Tax=unclassified Salinicola TaxID=2634022 RepID=UPI0008DDF37B|nr:MULTISPECIES: nucleotidyltransferase family protein [unclassified Salinicola]OHZ01912.1 mannose-1-phosphate guanylyltransferase [Salinicola sp. MIT1003]WQH32420.1 nucleotidyltransferase family protein [Salinicola sp. LHM]
MKAMILAAGLGTRMRPLTDHCPKPLLPVAGKPLIVHHLERLAAAGIHDIVINVSYRAQQIIDALGDGDRYGVSLTFSVEETPLETAGGLRKALPALGGAPFALVNGDVWTDFPLERLALAEGDLASLVMVDTTDFHRRGDFHLDTDGRLHAEGEPRLIYAGLGVIRPQLVADLPIGMVAKLAPLLTEAMQEGRVGGWHHRGDWVDVGTPQRLAELEARLRS